MVFYMDNQALPKVLQELRKTNNYTQDYVAEVLGVVRQTYSHYETGKRTPNYDALIKLADLYNISVDDLLNLSRKRDDSNSDSSAYTTTATELSNYIDYFNNPKNRQKYQYNTNLEKELLFYFEKLSESDKRELIDILKLHLQYSNKQ